MAEDILSMSKTRATREDCRRRLMYGGVDDETVSKMQWFRDDEFGSGTSTELRNFLGVANQS